jgi:hypothetical protein
MKVIARVVRLARVVEMTEPVEATNANAVNS